MTRKRKEHLFLKFRVVPTQRMQVRDAVKKLKQALRTGRVPDGIEIQYMDWEKGSGRKIRSGTLVGPRLLADMRKFYGALRAGPMRVRQAE